MQNIISLTIVSVAAAAASAGYAAPGDAPQNTADLLGASYGVTFGVNNFAGLAACQGINGIDGLPVVFDTPLDITTVDPADFVIVTASGDRVQPQCATFLPSVNADERQTILTQGEYGEPGLSPTSVEIVGSIQTADGAGEYRGATIEVIPWEVGAILVYARSLPVRRLGGLDQCPAGTGQIVQLAFGSNAGNQFPLTADFLGRFRVELADGSVANPFALADVTVDNYLELCLTETSPAGWVDIDANTITDASGQSNQVPIAAPVN